MNKIFSRGKKNIYQKMFSHNMHTSIHLTDNMFYLLKFIILATFNKTIFDNINRENIDSILVK